MLVGVWKIGILGMGIATACSYLLSCAVMLQGFISGKKAVYFRFRNLCFLRLPEAVRLGLSSLMMLVGVAARGYIMNRTLMSSIGAAAVAAMTVQSNVCSILGAILMGTANTFLTSAQCLLLMLFSGALSSFFFSPTETAWSVTRRMLLLFLSFLVFNVIAILLLKAYQIQDKTGLVNAISLAEPLIMALFAVGMIDIIGSDAVWLSFPFSEIICIIVLAISATFYAGRLSLTLSDWIRLDRNFGASAETCMEFSIQSIE